MSMRPSLVVIRRTSRTRSHGRAMISHRQISSEAKARLMWADRGIVYVGRHTAQRSRWALTCQFY
jgi:hypothetical protein